MRPVVTRWNTVCAVLERALDMEDVVTEVCDQAQFNKRDGVRLRRFVLNEEEWAILDDMYRLLDVSDLDFDCNTCPLLTESFCSSLLLSPRDRSPPATVRSSTT